MPGKPSFSRVDLLDGFVQVGGKSDEHEPPYEIHVTLMQEVAGKEEPHSAIETLPTPTSVWQVDLPSAGFKKGPCIVVGHEIGFEPNFSAHTWVQYMQIK